MSWLTIIEYRDFHDVPRMILVRARERLILLDCAFDEAADDYAPDYDLYELPAEAMPERGQDWQPLRSAGRFLGRIGVEEVRLDPTRRQAVEADALEALVHGSGR